VAAEITDTMVYLISLRPAGVRQNRQRRVTASLTIQKATPSILGWQGELGGHRVRRRSGSVRAALADFRGTRSATPSPLGSLTEAASYSMPTGRGPREVTATFASLQFGALRGLD
jgi:hypothetical protein